MFGYTQAFMLALVPVFAPLHHLRLQMALAASQSNLGPSRRKYWLRKSSNPVQTTRREGGSQSHRDVSSGSGLQTDPKAE
jgi:hypothetical protein